MLKLIGLSACAILLAILAVELLRLGRLRADRARFAKYWQQYSTQGEFVYLALGDSAAQGLGASRPERGYVGQIAKRLEASLKQPVRVVNLSVSGAKVIDVINGQLPELSKYRANLVTIDVGYNNLRRYDAASFRTQIDVVAAALPAGSFVADLPTARDLAVLSQDQPSAIIQAAAQRHGLFMVNLQAALRQRASWHTYAADFFHPNDRGYQIWADAFWVAIGPTL